ncbi:unnamed protein product [Sphenostylis stenocarpa]|uniref:Uncharacterized protein n=1 Tax=Sphenostylis stenocarpa TaxID=92480 RepID=A0AA86V4U0_9FABA|nr:unnamed protein product [Sphenostylis stenocarpa]
MTNDMTVQDLNSYIRTISIHRIKHNTDKGAISQKNEKKVKELWTPRRCVV